MTDPFLRQALMLAVDGTEPSELRRIMEVQIDAVSENEARIPAVFESAGGFSPTIGIIGAVIGLIQVMQHLDHMDEVGRGIAVAFVATIYGVGAANLFFLPAAGKLRQRAREDQRLREMALEGVISILEGMNPRMIEIKLAGFLGSATPLPPGHEPRAGDGEARLKSGLLKSRRSSDHVHHDRWLVSYADFITLLFAFFVVLYASSKADQQKQAQIAQSIRSAFEALGVFPSPPDSHAAPADTTGRFLPSTSSSATTLPPHPKSSRTSSVSQNQLAAALAAQVAQHNIALKLGRDGLVISLRESGFYDSGSAIPHPQSKPTLDKVAATIGATPYDIRIEGHTDNVPIHTAQFASNWELSTARATELAKIFIVSYRFAPARLSAAGFAEYHPVAGNDTPEGRSQNRRVDIIVLPRISVIPTQQAH